MPDGSPSWADPRFVLRRALAKAADMGFTFYTHPEIEFFLLKDQPEDGREPRPVDTGGYFDLTSHDVAHDFRRMAVDALEALGISVEFSHHEVAPGPAGDRPAVRGRADHRRQHHDVPARGEGGRDGRGGVRDVHAEAVHRPARLRHAHPPVAVRGRPQRLPRPVRRAATCPRPRARSSPGCCGTRGRSPRSPTSGSTRTSGCSAARRPAGGRGAGVRLLGAREPVGAGPGADVQARQGQLDPGRGALARPGLQPVPGLRADAGRRAERHRERVRAAARARRTTSGR